MYVRILLIKRMTILQYTRSLQGRETLRDIRLWVIKCCAPEPLTNKVRDLISHLRFQTVTGASLSKIILRSSPLQDDSPLQTVMLD